MGRIRGQLIHRGGSSSSGAAARSWSTAFPELVAAADGLPGARAGWRGDRLARAAGGPAAFPPCSGGWGAGAPGPACCGRVPWCLRGLRPARSRRGGPAPGPCGAARRLEALLASARRRPAPTQRAASSRLALADWQELEPGQRPRAGRRGPDAQAAASPYGRPPPGRLVEAEARAAHLDAVLLYAQAGSGRRANLFTDYTFAVWESDGRW